MRSWWVIALVIVGGLVAQPGDAWAGKLAEKGGFRDFKLGAKVTAEWFKTKGCTANEWSRPYTETYSCSTSNIGNLSVAYVGVSVFEGQIYWVKVDFDESETANAYFPQLEKIFVEAYGPPDRQACEKGAHNYGPAGSCSQEGGTQSYSSGSVYGAAFKTRRWMRVWRDGPYKVQLHYGDHELEAKIVHFIHDSVSQKLDKARDQGLERYRQIEKQEIKKAAESL